MNVLLVKLKTLFQLSFKQAILLSIGSCIAKVKGQNPEFISSDIFVMGNHLSDLIEHENTITKHGNLNLIKFGESSMFKGLSLYLRRMSTDFLIYGQVLKFKEYQPIAEKVIKDAKKQIEYIVDAGANIGCSSLYFKTIFPDAKIIAIEPQTGNFEMLSKNIKTNHHNDIYPLKAGLWKDNSDLEIDTGFRGGREYSFALKPFKNDKAENETVKGVTIKDLMTQYNFPYIDILKIDIEGGEKYLFENIETAHDILAKVNYIAMEIHDEIVDRQLIYSILSKLGFAFQNFQDTLVAWRQ